MARQRRIRGGHVAATAVATAPVTGTAPGPITTLDHGTPASYSFPFSFTAPTTGSPVTGYNFYVSTHGDAAWTLATVSGLTGTTTVSGTIVGLSPGVTYDYEGQPYNGFGAGPFTQDLRGLTTPNVASTPTPSQDATRFDNFATNSSSAPGSPVPIDIVLNGIARGQTVTGTVQSGSGSLSGAAAFANGAVAKQTVQYTPSAAGEHTISFTATGGSKSLFAPTTVMINCWTSSSGTARTISATLAPSIASGSSITRQDLATMQWRGLTSPRGFSGAIGFGPVFIQINSLDGDTDGLFARPYLGYSSGASSSFGTGTPLTSGFVQIYGPVSAGGFPKLIRTILPTWNDEFLYWDIATDAAGTNPVRLQQRCRVGYLALIGTRSQMTKVGGRGYPSNYESTIGVGYLKTSVAVAPQSGNQFSDLSGVHNRLDGAHGDPAFGSNGQNNNNATEPCGTGAMMVGKILSGLTGFGVEISGSANSGGNVDAFLQADGTPINAWIGTLQAATDGDPRIAIFCGTGLSTDPASQVLTDYTGRYSGFAGWFPVNMPSVAIVGINTGQTGWWGSDSGQQGSAPLGFTRLQNWVRDHLEAVDPRVVALDDRHCAAYYGGHYTLSGGGLQGTEVARRIAYAELGAARGLQSTNRGPTFGASGQRAAGTNLVRIPIFLGGGTALRVITIQQPNTVGWSYNAASNPNTTDLIDGVAIYDAGGYSNNGLAFVASNVTINTSNIPSAFSGAYATLDVIIAGSGGFGTKTDGSSTAMGALTAHIYADSGASGNGTGALVGQQTGYITIITNDDDPMSIGLGSAARAQLDIAVSVV